MGGFDMGNPGANIHLCVSGKSANIFAAADVAAAAVYANTAATIKSLKIDFISLAKQSILIK